MSSANPNLQNIPKSDLRVRYVICAGEGKVLVGADLDNVELRVLAAYAPGGALERAFPEGVDLHQQTADACGVERDEGKRLNYATSTAAARGSSPRSSAAISTRRGTILDRWYAPIPRSRA